MNHMLRHQLLVGVIDGDNSGCSVINTKVVRVCQGDKVEMACPKGTIDLQHTAMPATYGRFEPRYCSKVPSSMKSKGLMAGSRKCGTQGNVQKIVASQCQGSSSCSFVANDNLLGDQKCGHIYKYFSVVYTCSPAPHV